MHRTSRWSVAVALVFGSAPAASAEVVRVEITKRADVLGGQRFGRIGAYELIEGRIFFAFDPGNRYNGRIVDLALAPKNAAGKVEAVANFVVLKPKEPRPDAVGLFEVSNRGLKLVFPYLGYAPWPTGSNATIDLGDHFPMKLGLSVIWIGWQADVPERPGALRLDAPVVTAPNGDPITGLVRTDWVIARPARTLSLAHAGHVAYPVADPASPDNVLTVRDGRYAPRRTVPRGDWRFAREEGDSAVADPAWVHLSAGFEPGMIYELVYRARDPKVTGLGLAAIRDAIAHAKYDPASPFRVGHAIAFGISQTGRFLRHFVYQGFNTDEKGRRATDGLIIHIAGAGRGSFNHRFAQPSRDAHRFDSFFFPTDLFPFASRTETDPVTGAADGLFAHQFDPAHLPRIFQINGGYEYWGRAGALIHLSPDGRADRDPPPNERIYHLASVQHAPSWWPPPDQARMRGTRAYRGQPLDYAPPLRALVQHMVGWVRDGIAPPPSAYPKVAAGELVPVDRVRFPSIPDLRRPTVAHAADRLDFGPRWSQGVIDKEPPGVGPAFPVLVPQVDSIGNELGGIRTLEVELPLATYAPWNLRLGLPGDSLELSRIQGSYLPLPITEMDRKAANDPRPSIMTLYRSRSAYLARARIAAQRLIRRRMLLPEDLDRVVARAGQHWDWIMESR